MIIDGDKLYDKYIQFGQCIICHQFPGVGGLCSMKDTMNSQETSFKQYFAKPKSALGGGIKYAYMIQKQCNIHL